MTEFLRSWGTAAVTSLGLFWMAFWAFVLGYLVSSLVQVLITRRRMQAAMGDSGPRSIAIGTFFGFISSSCSFSALSTTRALFQKGAGLVSSIAFLLASTNLVVELGIVIAIFLGWQFVVGEYVGGLLLIGFAWIFVRLTRPVKIVEGARKRLRDQHGDDEGGGGQGWKEKLTSRNGWEQIATRYVMEWHMVWKDVLIGFTVAGIIATFVPDVFFEALFIGSGSEAGTNIGFFEILAQVVAGPIAAFFTFIGSMGNIPLAALLYDHGVSFAGIMAFIFSDLVVLPVLRINAQYYGWKMALYLAALLLTCLIAAALCLHYGLAAFDLLPDSSSAKTITERAVFEVGPGFFLNLLALAISAGLGGLWWRDRAGASHDHGDTAKIDLVMQALALLALAWLAGGIVISAAGLAWLS